MCNENICFECERGHFRDNTKVMAGCILHYGRGGR